jgi:hypothetical protein
MRRGSSDKHRSATALVAILLLPFVCGCPSRAQASPPGGSEEARADAATGEPVAAPGPAPAEAAPVPSPTVVSLSPLGDADKLSLAAVHLDPEPEAIIRDTHYFVSNELNPEYFRAALKDAGGVGLGVGAEQNYLYAGWARPELLLLVDFDQAIVDLHALYRVAFLNAATPEEFCALWEKPSRKRFGALIDAAYDGTSRPRAPHRIFVQARSSVEWRLNKIKEHFRELGIPTFVTDVGEYDYVRKLFLADRVVRLRGDLTGRRALTELGGVLKAQHRVVRWAYLSNAEQYFRYTPRFRKNIIGLPFDDKSLVIRTRAHRRDYAYVVQPLQNFTTWLASPSVRSVRAVVPHSLLKHGEPYVEIAGLPPPAPERKARRQPPEGDGPGTR